MSTCFSVYTNIISFLEIKCNQSVHFFPFGVLVNPAYSIILFKDHNFPNDVKMKTKHAFNKQKSYIFVSN